jgi:hypothetical protein
MREMTDSVSALVARFRENIDQYTGQHYNETQLRREFLDPLFNLLGWDIANVEGYAEPYKDVVHEDLIRIEGQATAPDYSFRIGGTRKFFLEAKRPSLRLRDNSTAALQLRTYGWTAGVPLSILSNFAEFAVYDCRVKPSPHDLASTARTMYFTYEDYLEKWPQISEIFRKEAILRGAFDRYALTVTRKRGTAEFDQDFLGKIELWRERLARNFALRNHGISSKQLNEAVQLTIDRIIFLRICEDRGIEPYGRLRNIVSGKDLYKKLATLLRQADARYNSGLFHFSAEPGQNSLSDSFTLSLSLDDRILREIIGALYYPISPYQFSVVPAQILGQIYERFLGKTIVLRGISAIVEERPEVRKAGGVYYTPAAVVRYIVDSCVARALEANTTITSPRTWPSSLSLHIVDPACGSGSFLIQAYQFLLDSYFTHYLESGPENYSRGRRPRLYRSGTGAWKLTIAERKRILLDHVFGVDIDPQAVEVTKLSLLLKILEGESEDSIARQMDLFNQRALPDLGSNIKCGNSLIDQHYFRRHPELLRQQATVERINAFDWKDKFKTVFEEGGFDVVIGNPPYRRELDYKELMDEIAETDLGDRYRAPRMDLWYYFVHRSLELLLKPHGRLGFIVNSYWTGGTGSEKLINQIREANLLDEVVLFGSRKVFADVSGHHMIMVLCKERKSHETVIKVCPGESDDRPLDLVLSGLAEVNTFSRATDQIFVHSGVSLENDPANLVSTLSGLPKLRSVTLIRQGIAENPADINRKVNKRFGNKFRVGAGVFTLSPVEYKDLNMTRTECTIVRPYHDLSDLDRYFVSLAPSKFIIYSTRDTVPDIKKFPHIEAHLRKFKPIMDRRRETSKGSNQWWHLHWPRELKLWTTPKIISVQMASRPTFATADMECYTSFSTNVVVPNDNEQVIRYALLGLLNSKVIWYWLCQVAKRRGVGLEINGHTLQDIPVPRSLDPKRPEIIEIAELARERTEMEITLRGGGLSSQQVASERQRISLIEARIDGCAARLYGLSEADLTAIEASLAGGEVQKCGGRRRQRRS